MDDTTPETNTEAQTVRSGAEASYAAPDEELLSASLAVIVAQMDTLATGDETRLEDAINDLFVLCAHRCGGEDEALRRALIESAGISSAA